MFLVFELQNDFGIVIEFGYILYMLLDVETKSTRHNVIKDLWVLP